MTKIVDVHYLSRGVLDGGNHFPSYFWFSEMVVLSEVCKPCNFESHNSLNLRFTNIQRLCLKFVGCKSFLEWNSLIFLLYMRQTWKTWLIQAISLLGVICLLLERIHYSNHSFAVYMKEGLAFAWDSSLENSEYSYLCFQLDLFCSVF